MSKRRTWWALLTSIAACGATCLHAQDTHAVNHDAAAWITQYEHDAAAADLAGDFSFYERHLEGEWSDGMSNGQFQTKKELIADLKNKAQNITFHEMLADIKVRVYGQTAVATYTETYDALINGNRVTKTIITTDTFACIGGEWKLVAAHSSAVPQEALARIVGEWELVTTEERLSDGSKRPYTDVGPRGKGILIYTADGHMCAMGMNPDRPAWNDVHNPTDADKLRAFNGFFGYCGRFEVDSRNHTVYHYPEVAAEPGMVGTKQKRPYALDGDMLTFSDLDTAPGVESYAIQWRRGVDLLRLRDGAPAQ